MRILDLSHPISAEMSVYPGSPGPILQPLAIDGAPGMRETSLTLSSHTGTHVDAPLHMLPQGPGLDQMTIDKFFGLALLINVSHLRGKTIELNFLRSFGERLADAKFLVFHTGYQQLWGKEEYLRDFPVMTEEAAQWLSGFDLNGVGVDAISVDPIDSTAYPIHKILFQQNLILVENLNNLDRLSAGITKVHGGYFLLSAMPLSFAQADGSPVRAIGYDVPEMLI
ncbi:MAG: cyclase family protein [Firmicutes bacterium]|nr:cyclase family protein [Bacillota bacterium]